MRRTHSPEKAPSRSAPVHPTAGAGSKSPITVRESLQKSGIVSSSHFSPPKERLAPASGSRLSTHLRNGMEDGSILNPNPVKAHDSGCGFRVRHTSASSTISRRLEEHARKGWRLQVFSFQHRESSAVR